MTKRILVLGFLTVLLTGLSSLASCGSQPGTVEGTVIDTQNGEPVVQAQVVVFELIEAKEVRSMDVFQKGVILQKQATDENGSYSFSLEPARYIIQVWVQGLEVADRMVKVEAGQITTLDLDVNVPSP